jgi:hypothetical protein
VALRQFEHHHSDQHQHHAWLLSDDRAWRADCVRLFVAVNPSGWCADRSRQLFVSDRVEWDRLRQHVSSHRVLVDSEWSCSFERLFVGQSDLSEWQRDGLVRAEWREGGSEFDDEWRSSDHAQSLQWCRCSACCVWCVWLDDYSRQHVP